MMVETEWDISIKEYNINIQVKYKDGYILIQSPKQKSPKLIQHDKSRGQIYHHTITEHLSITSKSKIKKRVKIYQFKDKYNIKDFVQNNVLFYNISNHNIEFKHPPTAEMSVSYYDK